MITCAIRALWCSSHSRLSFRLALAAVDPALEVDDRMPLIKLILTYGVDAKRPRVQR